MPTIISQPVSVSVRESYTATFSVAVDEFISDPSPYPGPIGYFDFRITYNWEFRTPGIPGWQSANRTITKNTQIPSTWGGPTKDSVFTDSLNLKANQNRNGKFYRCVITYRMRNLGGKTDLSTTTLTSSNATLTVTSRPHLFNLSSFSAIPDSQIVYRNTLVSAANRWNNLVTLPEYFIQQFPTYSGMSLSSYSGGYSSEDWIARCSPVGWIYYPWTTPRSQQFPVFVTGFNLTANTRFFVGSGTSFSAKDWENIMTHELGHALGIGSLTKSGVAQSYVAQGPQGPVTFPSLPRLLNANYPETVSAYNRIADNRPVFTSNIVPVEDAGGSGSSGVHWQNNFTPKHTIISGGQALTRPAFNGIVNELMVKSYGPGNPNNNFITDLSIAQLRDFGYQEVSPGARESGTVIVDSGNIVQTQSQSIYFCGTCCGEFK